MKKLTRFEIAACKRIAANTKSLRTKVEKLSAKIAELTTLKDTYLNEIAMWESPIVDKYGYSVEEILDGTYLLSVCNDEVPMTPDECIMPEDCIEEEYNTVYAMSESTEYNN